jgi:Flp pilus assembly pilin Flp
MFTLARLLGTMFLQRWQMIRDDERGASTIEYLLLVLLGIAVAGIAAVAITNAVTNKSKSIPDSGTP